MSLLSCFLTLLIYYQLFQILPRRRRGIDITPPNHSSLPPTAPTIIIAHGLTGGSHESYVRNVLEWVVKPEKEGGLGGRGVVANVGFSSGSCFTIKS